MQQVESEHAIGTVFVVTERGELFSSFDEGATWSVLTPAIDPAGGTLAVTIDPTNPLIAYRSTYGGVFKSTDAGRNWRRVDRGFAYRPNGAVAIAPAAPATLYVAMSGVCDTPATCRGLGVMKSVDGGASWTSAGLEHLAVRAIAAASSSVVYAATALDDWGNVYRSVDGALTWYPLFAPPTWVHSWHVHPVDPSVIYARVEQRLFVLLVRSTNGARTWELIRPEIDGYQPPPCTPDAIDCVAEPTIGPLLFDPRHPGVLYSSDWQGVVRSHDGGFHWTYVAGGPGEETAMAAMRVDGSILYAVGRTAGSVGVYECTLPEPTELYAFFRPAVTEERIGRPIQFTDLSVGRITSRTWDFGDGSTTTGQQPSHAYSTAGTYRVTLTVSDGLASHTFSRSIEIFDGRRRAVTRSGKAPR